MNFMSGRPGFYEELTGSSSSSSSQNKGLPIYTNNHHQESYGGGGAAAAPPPESSPTTNGSGGDDDFDDHMMARIGGGEGSSSIEKEHMFDKVVTPSDVGKLNRLVIPKQHAEKYFPLDSSANDNKGLLLNFEDRNGKQWRFRYSYWNSSQSYVMTKGWSRFVKEKKLDAGDIVSFQRGAGDLARDRLFIDWRRRPDAPELPPPPTVSTLSIPFSFQARSVHSWNNPLYLQPTPSRDYSNFLQHHQSHHNHNHYHSAVYGGTYPYNTVVNGNPCPPGSIMYLRSAPGGGGAGGVLGTEAVGQRGIGVEQMVFDSVPVVQGKAAAKRLRLFGVTMDCPISESDECDNILSSTTAAATMQIDNFPLHSFDSNSPSSSIPSLELRTYNNQNEDKGKGSMSLDLDI